jgi:hypothetical protein
MMKRRPLERAGGRWFLVAQGSKAFGDPAGWRFVSVIGTVLPACFGALNSGNVPMLLTRKSAACVRNQYAASLKQRLALRFVGLLEK